jgi:hypothetical protein
MKRESALITLLHKVIRQMARVRIRVMMFNVTFNNISAISWRSVLLVEETGLPRESNRHAASH